MLSINDTVAKYNSIGETKFYSFLLSDAIVKLVGLQSGTYSGISPEIELLNNSEKYLQLYRREDVDTYLAISRVYRKAGHKIYRLLLKKGIINKSKKFLNVV